MQYTKSWLDCTLKHIYLERSLVHAHIAITLEQHVRQDTAVATSTTPESLLVHNTLCLHSTSSFHRTVSSTFDSKQWLTCASLFCSESTRASPSPACSALRSASLCSRAATSLALSDALRSAAAATSASAAHLCSAVSALAVASCAAAAAPSLPACASVCARSDSNSVLVALVDGSGISAPHVCLCSDYSAVVKSDLCK
jgi:hypothetical protein